MTIRLRENVQPSWDTCRFLGMISRWRFQLNTKHLTQSRKSVSGRHGCHFHKRFATGDAKSIRLACTGNYERKDHEGRQNDQDGDSLHSLPVRTLAVAGKALP